VPAGPVRTPTPAAAVSSLSRPSRHCSTPPWLPTADPAATSSTLTPLIRLGYSMSS